MARRFAFFLCFWTSLASGAFAHPHVWVTAKADIVYDQGKVAAIRHVWTFDPAYSTYATQGLDTNRNGLLEPEELADLAKTNVESLAEFGFFTVLKANGAKQDFRAPSGGIMRLEGDALTLSFELPLKTPAAGRIWVLEVADPTFFVDFSLADGADTAQLIGAPQGCNVTVQRPKPVAQTQKPLSEAFFETLNSASSFGASYASRVMVACP